MLGTGTSGHDVAQELQAHGAEVTHHPAQQDLRGQPERGAERLRDLLGRHPVRGLRPAGDLVPYPVLQRSYQISTAKGREVDKALLEPLKSAAFACISARTRPASR